MRLIRKTFSFNQASVHRIPPLNIPLARVLFLNPHFCGQVPSASLYFPDICALKLKPLSCSNTPPLDGLTDGFPFNLWNLSSSLTILACTRPLGISLTHPLPMTPWWVLALPLAPHSLIVSQTITTFPLFLPHYPPYEPPLPLPITADRSVESNVHEIV